MPTPNPRRLRVAGLCAALVALTLTSAGATAAASGGAGAPSTATVAVRGGAIHGISTSWGFAFRGIPYAAPPIGQLRWRPPQPPADWQGVRDATQFAPSCPQTASPFSPPGRLSEDCLYLNVSTPTLRRPRRRPVMVWIHGGGFTQAPSRNYDAPEARGDGTRRRHDQLPARRARLPRPSRARAAARARPATTACWTSRRRCAGCRQNIARFGGDPHNVTISGESAGGVSVLAHLVSPLARAVPAGHRAERRVRAEPAVAGRRRGRGKAFAARGGMPGPDRDVPAAPAGRRARRQLSRARDPRCRRWQGAHRVDRNGATPRAICPRADPQRHRS